MSYYVYILQSEEQDYFYKGVTQNLEQRLQEHNTRKDQSSSKWKPYQLVWYAPKPNKSEAMILERKLKNLSRQRTVDFIKKYPVEDGNVRVSAVRL